MSHDKGGGINEHAYHIFHFPALQNTMDVMSGTEMFCIPCQMAPEGLLKLERVVAIVLVCD